MYTQRGRMPLSQSRLYWYLETFCKEVIKDHDEENTLDNGLSGLMDLYLILTTCTKKKRLSGVKHTRKKGGGGGGKGGNKHYSYCCPPAHTCSQTLTSFI
jgi:hypothetical protein